MSREDPLAGVSEHLARVLSAFKGVKSLHGGQFKAHCPAHEDRTESLTITEGRDGKIVAHCFAGCAFPDVVRAAGLEVADFFAPKEPRFTAWSGGQVANGNGNGNGNGRAKARVLPKGGGPTLAEYNYYDRDGVTLLFQVLRKANKQFPQRAPDGTGKWKWGLEGVERVLYRLPELLAGVRAGRRIFIVEGEKDCENLMALGFVATTNPGGAGKWRPEYNEDFRGAVVTILPDNDEPGRKHAQAVATALYGLAREIRIVELPGVDKKGDVSDWIQLVGDRERAIAQLKELVRQAPVWTPPPATGDRGDAADVAGVVPLHETFEETTDLGNTRRLVRYHGADLRHVPGLGWLAWDGRRWRRDDPPSEVVRRAKDTVRQILGEAKEARSDARRGALAAWAHRSQGAARIDAIVRLAATEPEIDARAESFDADPWLFNVANGTLDLRTATLRPHAREDYITRLAPVAYDPTAEAPRFRQALERIFGGNPGLLTFLQRATGYMLTGVTTEQVVFIWHGAGANGKSLLMELLRAMLGEYAARADFDSFLERKADGGPRNDLASLAGARLVSASESAEGRALAESVVKDITGGETIKARFLYREAFEFRPQFKVVLVSNHRPKIRGTDEGIWRRIRLVPFTVTIPERERDPKLFETLRAELPGVLRWAVQGCLDWQRDGLGAPPEVRDATASYRAESDVIGAFLDECCLVEPHATATPKELHDAYTKWAQEQGERPLASRTLGVRLAERGFQRAKSSTIRWVGLRVRPASTTPTTGAAAASTPRGAAEPAEEDETTLFWGTERADRGSLGGLGADFGNSSKNALHEDNCPPVPPNPPKLPSPISLPPGQEGSEGVKGEEGGQEEQEEHDWTDPRRGSSAAAGPSRTSGLAVDHGIPVEPAPAREPLSQPLPQTTRTATEEMAW